MRDIARRSQELRITEEMIARQPPKAQAIIRMLLTRIVALDSRIAGQPAPSLLSKV